MWFVDAIWWVINNWETFVIIGSIVGSLFINLFIGHITKGIKTAIAELFTVRGLIRFLCVLVGVGIALLFFINTLKGLFE